MVDFTDTKRVPRQLNWGIVQLEELVYRLGDIFKALKCR